VLDDKNSMYEQILRVIPAIKTMNQTLEPELSRLLNNFLLNTLFSSILFFSVGTKNEMIIAENVNGTKAVSHPLSHMLCVIFEISE
jgi:hypothetical protein